jgi:hypothetical protein
MSALDVLSADDIHTLDRIEARFRKRKDASPLSSSPSAKRTKALFSTASSSPITRVVRLRRSHGMLVQGCDVYVGRACFRGGWELTQSKWHNPYTVRSCGSAAIAVQRFERYLLNNKSLMSQLSELKGKTLGCWCKSTGNEPCHGDVLARLADQQ